MFFLGSAPFRLQGPNLKTGVSDKIQDENCGCCNGARPDGEIQGFPDASSSIDAGHVVIRNGVIGRSAHHGIHGNDNVNVHIHDVDFALFLSLASIDGREIAALP